MELKIKKQSVFTTYLALQRINADELVEKTYLEIKTEFDENGHLLSQSKYLPSGILESAVENSYDEKGNLVKEQHFLAENEISEKRTFSYQSDKLMNEYLHYLDGSFDTIKYEYDEDGLILRKKTIDSEGEIESEKEYHYTDGRLSEVITKDSSGEIIETEKYIWDEKGNVLEKSLSGKEILDENILNVYDENSRIIKSSRKTKKETVSTSYTYDEQGRIIEEVDFAGNKQLKKMTYIYGENNLLMETIETFTVSGLSFEQSLHKKVEYEFF